MNSRFEIVTCATSSEYAAAAGLIRAYATELGRDLCFQGFEAELKDLPAMYGPPSGVLLLARSLAEKGEFIGCGAVRTLEKGVCEMKRLYVRPAARRTGLGRLLAAELLERARAMGFARMRLDTLADMHAAVRLYESLGFARIQAYYHNPLGDPLFFERAL